ncbi:FAD:protein FMN transferase [Paenibacillus artemisiicola]|nr:FAD:protein FMN transferase [Paenibacillus artemisiicola]
MKTMHKAKLMMGTVVDMKIVYNELTSREEMELAIDRAFEVFRSVEQACSRFSADSELMKACLQREMPVRISPLLYEPLHAALEMARMTKGRFDPTIGSIMEAYGFNRHYLTGGVIESRAAEHVSYQDVILDEQERTLRLLKPMVLDLGASAKGFAVDLASHELNKLDGAAGFVINAGGDLYAKGVNDQELPWKVGIRHPIHQDHFIAAIDMSQGAVCTSGSYERKSPSTAGIHHLIAPASKQSPNDWISCSVIAPYAMMADLYSTAAFVLGAEEGRRFIEDAELDGLLVTPGLQVVRIGGGIQ